MLRLIYASRNKRIIEHQHFKACTMFSRDPIQLDSAVVVSNIDSKIFTGVEIFWFIMDIGSEGNPSENMYVVDLDSKPNMNNINRIESVLYQEREE